MTVFVCICTSAHTRMYVHPCTYSYVNSYNHALINMYVRMYNHTPHTHACICTSLLKLVCVCIRMYCMYVCMYFFVFSCVPTFQCVLSSLSHLTQHGESGLSFLVLTLEITTLYLRSTMSIVSPRTTALEGSK